MSAAHELADLIAHELTADDTAGLAGVGFAAGSAGVARFFLELARSGDWPGAEQLAIHQLERVAVRLESLPTDRGWTGGPIGAAPVLFEGGILFGRSDFIAAARQAASRTANNPSRGDLYQGLSGAMLILLQLHSISGEERWVEEAEGLARGLIERFLVPHASGLFLRSAHPVRLPLAGLAHGASGAALALATLWSHTHDQRYAYVARSLIEYEDGTYHDRLRTWPDGRLTPGECPRDSLRPVHAVAWCGGRGGLATVRVLLERIGVLTTPRGIAENERDDAWLWEWRGPADLDHTLCCGFGGAIELHLLSPAEPLSQKYLSECLAALHAGHQRDGRWLAERKLLPDRPRNGFLKGRAGLAHMLLRVAVPERVPSQLLFASSGSSADHDATPARERVAQFRRDVLAAYGGQELRNVAQAVTGPRATPSESFARDLAAALGELPGAQASVARYRAHMESRSPWEESPGHVSEADPDAESMDLNFAFADTTRLFEVDGGVQIVWLRGHVARSAVVRGTLATELKRGAGALDTPRDPPAHGGRADGQVEDDGDRARLLAALVRQGALRAVAGS